MVSYMGPSFRLYSSKEVILSCVPAGTHSADSVNKKLLSFLPQLISIESYGPKRQALDIRGSNYVTYGSGVLAAARESLHGGEDARRRLQGIV